MRSWVLGARGRTIAECLLAPGVIAAVSAYLWRNGQREFDFFDMSAFLDAGYRVWRGQRPFVDFFYNAGPVHLYMHAASFSAFGFGRTAILAHLVAVTAVAMAATYIVARRRLPAGAAMLVTAVSGFALAGPASHPWYDSNACMWLSLGLLAHTLTGEQLRLSRRRFGIGLAGVACGLALLTKTNVGVAGGSVLALAVVLKHGGRVVLPAFAGGIVLVLALIFGLRESVLEFGRQTLVAYRPLGRLLDVGRLLAVVADTPRLGLVVLGLCVVVVGGGARFVRAHRDLVALAVGLPLAAIVWTYTGSMVPAANLGSLGMETALLWMVAREARRARGSGLVGRVAECAVAAMALYCLGLSIVQSERLATWRWRDSAPVDARNLSDYSLRAPALRGWRCNEGIGRGFDGAVEYVAANVGPGQSLFVFPDATVLYGVTGRESFVGAPFAFHLGTVPPPGTDYDRFREAFLRHPPDWMVVHRSSGIDWIDADRLLDWLRLREYVGQHYETRWERDQFRVMRRTGPPGG